ncbi:MAG: TonB-like protein [Candidatus Angelobacter sp.]|jgi:TonB family protein|nr:TonB-like protein [Candidatus Angelobacter sp.]
MLNSNLRKLVPVVLVAMLTLLLSGLAFADGRVTKQKVSPAYPELAKKMNVVGVVKVELTVLPNGQVKSAKAIGGHPLLIDASVNAAKQFKYEAGSDETKEIVEFKFTGAAN